MELIDGRSGKKQTLPERRSSETGLRKHSEKSLAVIERYGNGLQFAGTFPPSIHTVCARHLERSFMGDSPTLGTLRQAYPYEQIEAWLTAHIEDLNDYVGVSEKMNPKQMYSLIDIITTEYYYLKVSELMVFFYKLKAGTYGRFYGTVDPIAVSNALIEFTAYRRAQIESYERERRSKDREKQMDEWQAKAVPCPDNLVFIQKVIKDLNE